MKSFWNNQNQHVSKKNHYLHFSGNFPKNYCFKSFRKFPEKRLQQSSFKDIRVPNLSPIALLKTESTTDVSCERCENLKIAEREISSFYNPVEYSLTCISVFQKVAHLEISSNCLLPNSLQFVPLLKRNSQSIFLKVFLKFWKIPTKSSVMEFLFS